MDARVDLQADIATAGAGGSGSSTIAPATFTGDTQSMDAERSALPGDDDLDELTDEEMEVDDAGKCKTPEDTTPTASQALASTASSQQVPATQENRGSSK